MVVTHWHMITYDLAKEKLQSMGIVYQDIKEAVVKNGKPVNLWDGHCNNIQSSLNLDPTLEDMRCWQEDYIEEDLMCVIKAEASGI